MKRFGWIAFWAIVLGIYIGWSANCLQRHIWDIALGAVSLTVLALYALVVQIRTEVRR